MFTAQQNDEYTQEEETLSLEEVAKRFLKEGLYTEAELAALGIPVPLTLAYKATRQDRGISVNSQNERTLKKRKS